MSRDIPNISLHIVNDRLVVGGVATIIRMLRNESLAQGAKCTLWVDESDGAMERETNQLAWGLNGWRKWMTVACAPAPVKLVASIVRDKIRGLSPVLHLNTPYLSTALTTLVASFFTRAPIVYTVHANKSHISAFYWALENFIYRRADRVILELSVSLSDYRGKSQQKITFIPFGVRQANTVRKWTPRSAGPFTFIAVNRMDRNRMVDVFIEAFAAQMAANDAELLLVGDGEEKAALTELAIRLGCGERVRFSPAVEEVAIQDLLVASDCFLTLTASGEVGMAGKLAAGVGIPCLAYEFDQSVPADYSAISSEQLAFKMAQLAKATASELLDHASRTTAALHSSSEDMVSAYMRAYAEVAK